MHAPTLLNRHAIPFIALVIAQALLIACGDPTATGTTASDDPRPLLVTVPTDSSGIRFINTITESPEVNYYTYVYAYNGGGVGVGDLDNDGLQDLWFTGNQVPDRIYRNRGGLEFEDVTQRAIGDRAGDGWRTGVCMADVNADGWLDVYVCRAGPGPAGPNTRNLLYINNGDLTFTERAHEFGVDDSTHSTQAVFFDLEKDGDLDLYVLNTPAGRIDRLSNYTAMAAVKARQAPTCRLFRNDGERFTDATYDSDVQSFVYGLGVSATDLDADGWTDLYAACDFDSPDLMYRNQHDGTFQDQLQMRTRHVSNFSMGCDAADYDNDGLVDLCVLDMTADDHLRNKTNMGSMSPERFWANVRGGFFFQYMVNTLQHNNGNGTFSEIGQLAGIARTDWSWAPLFCDLDNDGWKDLLVTNGYKHDVRNNDFLRSVYDTVSSGSGFYGALDLVPSTRLRNYLFRNNGDLTFSDSSTTWGFDVPVNSNGAAYADLDNDGDLDVVINNLDEAASLFENTAAQRGNHWSRVRPLDGKTAALGARVIIRSGGTMQMQELYPVRGYQSTVEQVLHFGLGTRTIIDSLEVTWPNGSYTVLTNVPADSVITIDQSDASAVRPATNTAPPLFNEVAGVHGLDRQHQENAYNDFALEVLLPHRQSACGPLLGTADVNGDRLDDLLASGGHGQAATLLVQNADGRFSAAPAQPWAAHRDQETLGSVFFDAEGDGDADLLLLAGGTEQDLRDPVYTQRLYANNGSGRFSEAVDALPALITSAMRADAGDVDGDGDMDLFIGGRITPAHYPYAPRSYLLLNDGTGRFADATEQLAPAAMGPGLVTAVEFADVDGDRDPDLLLAGEWMNVMLLRNDGGRFTDASAAAGLDSTQGWWSSLATADVNGDGHLDIIGGNLGWNSKFKATPQKPLHVYWADFDDNGRHDIVLAKEKEGHLLPVRGRECSSQQCPMITQKFKTYEEFARADLPAIYTPEKLASAYHRSATFMKSAVFLNDGKGRFSARPLPMQVQTAPINGIVPLDVNGDGKMDLVVAGNHWGAEVETVRYDAGTGLVLLGDGSGGFTPMSIAASGFFAWGDVKDLAMLRVNGTPTIVVSNNNDKLQAFALRASTKASLAMSRPASR